MIIDEDENQTEYTRENAKKEFDAGNYSCSKNMLENLWEKSDKKDPYLLVDYGKSLRKVNQSGEFIEICRVLYKNKIFNSNPYIISNLCWCLYDYYIKNYKIEDVVNFDGFIKSANYIRIHSEQLDADKHHLNPYVMTIRKVVKIYNNRASTNYKEVIKWLSFLNPDRLSEKVFNFKDDSGKDRELASMKEFFYQNMIKALEKTQQYEKCILTCEIALEQIRKFHHRNDTWIKARLYYSKCMVLEDIDSAINEYRNLAYIENYWFMYYKLSQICFRYNKIPEALLYASKAYEYRFEHERMVNLLLDTALLWQAVNNDGNAKQFFQASAYYKNRQAWAIPEELVYAINIFKIDVEQKPNITVLLNIAKSYVASIEGKGSRLEGIVKKMFSHGGSGFIKPNDNDSDVYFNTNDVFGKKTLSEGDLVEFELVKGKDDKIRAVKIAVRG